MPEGFSKSKAKFWDPVRIFRVNIQSVKNKTDELDAILRETLSNCVCLTEHWLNLEAASNFRLESLFMKSVFAHVTWWCPFTVKVW